MKMKAKKKKEKLRQEDAKREKNRRLSVAEHHMDLRQLLLRICAPILSQHANQDCINSTKAHVINVLAY